MEVIETEGSYFFECPHCGISIEVKIKELNCRIFRCGQFKDSGKQIPPHSSKKVCDNLAKNNLIYGCGKPFNIIEKIIKICDYI
jgi:hypothetical protein